MRQRGAATRCVLHLVHGSHLVLLGLVKLYRLPVQTVMAPMRSPVNGT
jgi:hypothetical protein